MTSCQLGAANCDTAAEQGEHTYYFSDLFFDLNLGYGKSQPLEFSITQEGHVRLALAPVISATAKDYYENAEKSYIYVGNTSQGGLRPLAGGVPVGGLELGSFEVDGIRIHQLELTTHDL